MQLKAGQLANMTTQKRLNIHAETLAAVEWWGSKPVEVTAELVEAGLIRVYLATEAAPMIEELKSELQNLLPQLRFDRAVVLADRYRSLTLAGNGQLALGQEVIKFLGFSEHELPTLFVQPFPTGLEIMTLDHRSKRLARTAEGTSIELRFRGME